VFGRDEGGREMPTSIRSRSSDSLDLERQATLVTALFKVALDLQQAMKTDGCVAQAHLSDAVAEVEAMIANVRSQAFATASAPDTDADRRQPRPPWSSVVRRLPTRAPVSPADLTRLLDQSKLLAERMHRVATALTITEDLVADTYEELARCRPRRAEENLLAAKHARARADDFREVLVRLRPQP